MHQVFLSYSFQNENEPLLPAVRSIIECAGFRIIDGRALQGFQVTEEVKKQIARCSGLVGIMTPEAAATGWVGAEFQQAIGANKSRLFMLCQEHVQLPNPFQGVAICRYSDATMLQAITTLASTLGMWKQSLGNLVRVVILPPDLAEKAHTQNATCQYRCEEQYDFNESNWQTARLRPDGGSVLAILPEVKPYTTVQLRLTFADGSSCTSAFVPQDLQLQLQ